MNVFGGATLSMEITEDQEVAILESPAATGSEELKTENNNLTDDDSPFTNRATPVSTPSQAPDHDISGKARDLGTTVLNFLSNASNETLGACLVGLGAATYLILGRIGLLLIGVVAGVLLHATWENRENGSASEDSQYAEGRRRKEKGLDIVQRLLDLRPSGAPNGDSDTISNDGISTEKKLLDFTGFAPETKAALEHFRDAVIRDYVAWWYKPILPREDSFVVACSQMFTRFLLSISNRLSRKRPGDVFLDFLTNSSSIVIVFLNELSAALSASRDLDPQRAIEAYLEKNQGCSLDNVLDQEQQTRKLQAVSEDVVQTFVDAEAKACNPVKTFLREIFGGLILDMTIASCSRADFINEWIIWGLEESGTTELVEAIDAGVNQATNNPVVKGATALANGFSTDGDVSRSERRKSTAETKAEHRRTVSKAEAAMEEAMLEAQKINDMIAEEEAKKRSSLDDAASTAPATDESAIADEDVLPANGSINGVHVDAETQHVQIESPPASPQEDQPAENPGFKSFDQILGSQKVSALQAETSPLPSPPLVAPHMTLQNARISIFDDSVPGEKGNLKSKPTIDYFFQVEPESSAFPGWMIPRKYSDVEALHEILRRISVISGVTEFTTRHPALPTWKGNTKAGLRTELEKYLQDALSFRRLAESEAMKRFLDKDQHVPKASQNKNFGQAAFENMGKGVVDVLSSAPKGVATGGKAFVGGVAGVFGGVAALGQKKQSSKNNPRRESGMSQANGSITSLPSQSTHDSKPSQSPAPPTPDSPATQPSMSRESLQLPTTPDFVPELPPRPSRQSEDISNMRSSPPPDSETMSDTTNPTPKTSLDLHAPQRSPSLNEAAFNLPPPPSEISDDYRLSSEELSTLRTSTSTDSPAPSPTPPAPTSDPQPPPSTHTPTPKDPLTIQETTIAVELFFATINELYTLSSAWTLRLTLLNTAKSFLLRPGNSNLEAIRQLLQSTIIDANTTPAGIAAHITKMRENGLPTEEELKRWPPPLSREESERRRDRARRLLCEKGMPQALTSVMGQAASAEALGKVFDCLQVERVARGLVFAVLLQAVRALTQ